MRLTYFNKGTFNEVSIVHEKNLNKLRLSLYDPKNKRAALTSEDFNSFERIGNDLEKKLFFIQTRTLCCIPEYFDEMVTSEFNPEQEKTPSQIKEEILIAASLDTKEGYLRAAYLNQQLQTLKNDLQLQEPKK